MSGVFLSYRRDDTADDARRIYDRLAGKFGSDLVYLDVEDIPLGVDFTEHITAALKTAAYVLIAIGPRWLMVTDDVGHKRLEAPDDPVRLEIRTALENKRLVVPMLIGGAGMPRARELPREIAPLVRHNGIAIRPDPDFEADVAALMNGLSLERIDTKQVPTVFRVGLMARDLGLGGSVGWGLLGVILGLFTIEKDGLTTLIGLTVAGIVAGMTGGALVGWLTGFLIRKKAPPLVPRSVRRMGVAWSVGLLLVTAIGGVVGYFVGMDGLDQAGSGASTIGEAIGEVIVGVFVAVFTMILITFLGLIVGSGLAAAYFARKLRLRSEEITRTRGFIIGIVWLLGGIVSAAAFLLLIAVGTQ